MDRSGSFTKSKIFERISDDEFFVHFGNDKDFVSILEEMIHLAEKYSLSYTEALDQFVNWLNIKLKSIHVISKIDVFGAKYSKEEKYHNALKKIVDKYPFYMMVRGDKNSFYRSFMLSLVISLILNKKTAVIVSLMKKISSISLINFKHKKVKANRKNLEIPQCFLLSFLYECVEFSLGVRQFNLRDFVLHYNSSPIVDFGMVIFSRHLILTKFEDNSSDPQYKHLFDKVNQNKTKNYLNEYSKEAEEFIFPLAAQAFQVDLVIQNLYLQNKKYNTNEIQFNPLPGSDALEKIILCCQKDHFESLIPKDLYQTHLSEYDEIQLFENIDQAKMEKNGELKDDDDDDDLLLDEDIEEQETEQNYEEEQELGVEEDSSTMPQDSNKKKNRNEEKREQFAVENLDDELQKEQERIEQEELKSKQLELEKKLEDERLQKEAEEARIKKEAEEARIRQEAEEARKKQEAEEARIKKEAEEARIKKEAEEARIKKEAEEAKIKKEAEEARIKKEAEEAEEARIKKEAEEVRLKKEAEEARRKKEAEEARIKQEAEEARKKKDAEEARIKKEAEEARIKQEAEEARKKKDAEEKEKQRILLEKQKREAEEIRIKEEQINKQKAESERQESLLKAEAEERERQLNLQREKELEELKRKEEIQIPEPQQSQRQGQSSGLRYRNQERQGGQEAFDSSLNPEGQTIQDKSQNQAQSQQASGQKKASERIQQIQSQNASDKQNKKKKKDQTYWVYIAIGVAVLFGSIVIDKAKKNELKITPLSYIKSKL